MNPNTTSKLRVGIIGAGTAGLASAIAFARAGHRVKVLEKHQALATLGAGLLIQPQGVTALEELGVGPAFEAASVPIDRLHGKCHRDWTLVDIAYPQQHARAVVRAALAQLLLHEALEAGAEVLFDTEVKTVETRGTTGLIHSADAHHEFDVVVIADGAASALPEQVGLAVSSTLYQWGALWSMFDVEHWPHERVLQQRFRTTRQMFGLMPSERRGDRLRLSMFWSLPCAAYPAWKSASLEKWKDGLLDLWPEAAPVVSQIASHDQFTLATYRHAWPSRLANPPVCVIGDAAHSMSPQLGLGATLAVQDALILARHVEAFGPQNGLVAFSRQRLRSVRAYQTLSRALTPCFQADGSGWWRDVMFALGLKVPGVPWLMYRSIAQPQGRKNLPEAPCGA